MQSAVHEVSQPRIPEHHCKGDFEELFDESGDRPALCQGVSPIAHHTRTHPNHDCRNLLLRRCPDHQGRRRPQGHRPRRPRRPGQAHQGERAFRVQGHQGRNEKNEFLASTPSTDRTARVSSSCPRLTQLHSRQPPTGRQVRLHRTPRFVPRVRCLPRRRRVPHHPVFR